MESNATACSEGGFHLAMTFSHTPIKYICEKQKQLWVWIVLTPLKVHLMTSISRPLKKFRNNYGH